MSTFALIHGAWGSGWHWASVPERLRAQGHDVVAPDLPCEDPAAGPSAYAQVVVDALAGAGDDVVVVGYSLGGLTAPLVAAARPVRRIVYVAALVAEPGASVGDRLRRGDPLLLPEFRAGLERDGDVERWVDFDVYWRTSCQDCAEAVARGRYDRARAQAVQAYRERCPLAALPDVPSRYVLCANDRLVDHRSRPGIAVAELEADHSPMASRPGELVGLLV